MASETASRDHPMKDEQPAESQEQDGVSRLEFEKEKWRADVGLRRIELRFRERELDLKTREQDRLAVEANRSRWASPLFLGVVAACIAAGGGAIASLLNGRSAQETERLKAESARILEAIKAGDPEKTKNNLRFLVATGLISEASGARIETYISHQPLNSGPFLPSVIDVNPARLIPEINALSELVPRAPRQGLPNASPSRDPAQER
jgi:hypothetical protein